MRSESKVPRKARRDRRVRKKEGGDQTREAGLLRIGLGVNFVFREKLLVRFSDPFFFEDWDFVTEVRRIRHLSDKVF